MKKPFSSAEFKIFKDLLNIHNIRNWNICKDFLGIHPIILLTFYTDSIIGMYKKYNIRCHYNNNYSYEILELGISNDSFWKYVVNNEELKDFDTCINEINEYVKKDKDVYKSRIKNC